jgi:hypothetical protein
LKPLDVLLRECEELYLATGQALQFLASDSSYVVEDDDET